MPPVAPVVQGFDGLGPVVTVATAVQVGKLFVAQIFTVTAPVPEAPVPVKEALRLVPCLVKLVIVSVLTLTVNAFALEVPTLAAPSA